MGKVIVLSILMFLIVRCSSGESTSENGFAPGLDPIPEDFQIEQVNGDDAQLVIAWTKSNYASKYKLFYKRSSDTEFYSIDSIASPYTLAGLTNGVTYTLKIQAINDRGDRYSSEIQAVPQPTVTLAKVNILESVHSSIQNHTTIGNYKVSGSLQLGFGTKLKVTTSPRGYQLHLSAQGNILTGGQNE